MSLRRLTAIAAVTFLLATPSKAVFGEENIALAAIAAQTAASLVSLGDLIKQGNAALETAQLTSKTLRDASEVVVDLAYLSQNPDEIFDQAQQAFTVSFPEIEAIARDAEAINKNLGSLNAPPERTILDLIAHSRATGGNAYQAVMSFNNTTLGMLDPYLKQLKLIEKTSEETEAIRLSARVPLDVKNATILTAKATANMATSLNMIASSQLEVARIKQQEYLEAQQAKAQAAIRNRQIGTSTPDSLMPTSDDLTSDQF
jgi:hypothetical protein